jgi:hypothetical protein
MQIEFINWAILFCIIALATAAGIALIMYIDEWKHK